LLLAGEILVSLTNLAVYRGKSALPQVDTGGNLPLLR